PLAAPDVVEAVLHPRLRPDDVDRRRGRPAEAEVDGDVVLRGVARAGEDRARRPAAAGRRRRDDGADAVAVDHPAARQTLRPQGGDVDPAVAVAAAVDLD